MRRPLGNCELVAGFIPDAEAGPNIVRDEERVRHPFHESDAEERSVGSTRLFPRERVSRPAPASSHEKDDCQAGQREGAQADPPEQASGVLRQWARLTRCRPLRYVRNLNHVRHETPMVRRIKVQFEQASRRDR